MAMSVNTNKSALIALQNLTATNEQLADVQSKINTGLRVANAKDSAWTYADARKSMNIGDSGVVLSVSKTF